jgi:ankyrin repeat protein
MVASQKGHASVVQLLLEAGADKNFKNEVGENNFSY